MKYIFLICIMTITLACSVCSAALDVFPFASVPELDGTATVDGIADEAFWDQAADLGPMGTIDAMGTPQYETTTKMASLSSGLIIFIKSDYLDKSKLPSMHAERDSEVWMDECVEVFFQPKGSKYKHFIVNPRSTLYDELERNSAWNAAWSAKSVITDAGWNVEMLIPWGALGSKPTAGTVWRFNVGRSAKIENSSQISSWSPVNTGFHTPSRFGYICIGANNWVSSINWGPREPGDNPASASVVVKGKNNKLTAAISGKPGSAVTVGNAAALVEKPQKEGFRNIVVSVKAKEQVARLVYGVRTSPIDEIITQVQRRLSKINSSNTHVKRTVSRIKQELNTIAASAKGADKENLKQLENKLLNLNAMASSIPSLISSLKVSKQQPVMAYGIEIPLLKILKIDAFEGQPGGQMTLKASKGEVTAAQLALFTYEKPAAGVNIRFTNLKGPKGTTIPASCLRARQVGYVQTKKPVYTVRYVGLWPDPLLTDPSFDMQSDSRELVWIDLKTPRNVPAGIYSGSIQVFSGNNKVITVPLKVRVWGFDMPRQNHLYTGFGGNESMGVSNDTIWTNMLEHRVSPYNCVGGPEPVSNPSMDWSKYERIKLEVDTKKICTANITINATESAYYSAEFAAGKSEKTFELNSGTLDKISEWRCTLYGTNFAKIKITLLGKGAEKVLSDTEVMAPSSKGKWISDWPSVSGSAWLTPDTPAVWDWTKFDENMSKRLPMGLTAFTVGAANPGGWLEWQKHLSAKGWLSMGYTYLWDEPEPVVYPHVNAVLESVKKAAPGIRNMMTSRGYPEELYYVDIWCPEIYSFNPEGAKKEQARGRTCWWYTAFSTKRPYVNVWTDYPALDCRIWPWMTWKHNLDGMLYWSINYWSLANPWDSAMGYIGANGDGSMVYPGKNGEVVDSLRWECLRDGLQDYEVFCLLEAGIRELKAMGKRPDLVKKAQALCNINPQVLKSYKEFSENPRDILRERDNMSAVLEQIVKVLGRNPVIKGRPTLRKGLTEADIASLKAKEIEAMKSADEEIQYSAVINAEPEPGLVAKYNFDVDVPFAADSSGMALHGIVNNGEYVKGIKDNGLKLSNNGWVKLPAGVSVLGSDPVSGTVSLWVKPSTDIDQLPGGTWEGYSVLFYAMPNNQNGLPDGYFEVGLVEHGSQLIARCGGKEQCMFAVIPTPLRKDQWTHLALTWEKGIRRLYVDGKLAAEATNDFLPPRMDATPVSIGNHPSSNKWRFDGTVDNVRIYNRALTESDIVKISEK